jgi:GAF domain-containing protein
VPDARVDTTVSSLARRAVPGTAEVSVTLVGGDGPHTAAFTGRLARSLDERQYEIGNGPCLEAATTAATLSVPKIAREDRWPEWAAHSLEAGVHSSLSIGLPVRDSLSGALNFYATVPDAFDEDAVVIAQTFAGYAAVTLINTHLYQASIALTRNMQAAMESRAVIEQAKGIIMGERRCDADAAFQILTTLSQEANRKLRTVAAALVDRAAGPPR